MRCGVGPRKPCDLPQTRGGGRLYAAEPKEPKMVAMVARGHRARFADQAAAERKHEPG